MENINRNLEKELYMEKNAGITHSDHDESCRKKSPLFVESRTMGDFESCFKFLCQDMSIDIKDGRFVHFFDFDYQFSPSAKNLTPGYDIFLKNGITNLKYPEDCMHNQFCLEYNSVIDDMSILITRIVDSLEKTKPSEYKKKQSWFRRMLDDSAETLEEALQRILFLGQLLWQTGSRLVGFGRLDVLLYPYYCVDIRNGIGTNEINSMIRDFLQTAHSYYWYKSDVLIGDTGQVITLGGIGKDDTYIFNELSECFLDNIETLGLSDPKIVLRVSRKMPIEVMRRAVKCMATGNGSPLLSNDDVIVPILAKYGVGEYAYEYSTSACWEPLIGGRSSSMNNQACLSFIKAFTNLLMEEKLEAIKDYHQFEERYYYYLKREILKCKYTIDKKVVNRNTLYSIFVHGCYENQKDLINGGADFNDIGMTTVGLGNLVNSLLNIKQMVFEENKYSLIDIKKISINNYEGYEDGIIDIKRRNRFGCDDPDVVDLTNRLLRFVSQETYGYRTLKGQRIKFGMSSPSYIFESKGMPASFDGRRYGDPFIVHISNENMESYTELINFASKLDYGDNRFNGNVVDLIIAPGFLRRYLDKISTVFYKGIEKGFFQLQTNVVESDTLIEAQKHPEEYGNLIVRVWGFSAYFVQLPMEFQNLLISRARVSEANR